MSSTLDLKASESFKSGEISLNDIPSFGKSGTTLINGI